MRQATRRVDALSRVPAHFDHFGLPRATAQAFRGAALRALARDPAPDGPPHLPTGGPVGRRRPHGVVVASLSAQADPRCTSSAFSVSGTPLPSGQAVLRRNRIAFPCTPSEDGGCGRFSRALGEHIDGVRFLMHGSSWYAIWIGARGLRSATFLSTNRPTDH